MPMHMLSAGGTLYLQDGRVLNGSTRDGFQDRFGICSLTHSHRCSYDAIDFCKHNDKIVADSRDNKSYELEEVKVKTREQVGLSVS